jgi:elongation factor Ts
VFEQMAEITASLVKQLRDRTQLPMMDCKRALQESDGDLAKAEDFLRKSGALAAAKKAGRETAEGRIAIHITDDNSSAGIVEVRCETAPVANTDAFVEMCHMIARHIALSKKLPGDAESLLGQTLVFDSGRTIRACLEEVINKLRENIQIQRFTRLTGKYIAGYEHHNGQVAVLIAVESNNSSVNAEKTREFGRDLCMHITAINPAALDRDQIPAEVVEKEKAIIQAQVAQQAQGKPVQIIEKIVQGKINKWYNELVLLEQPFVKDDKKTVKQAIAEFNKSIGQSIEVKQFLRFEVGGVS